MNNPIALAEKIASKKQRKPKLGTILTAADLVSESQVIKALEYQKESPSLRLGEILAHRGLIDPRTCDFFAGKWNRFIELDYRKPLGYYLLQAGLLEKSDIEEILSEQQLKQYRFGKIAAMKGYVKPTTVDFFLQHLFPEELGASPDQRTLESLLRSQKRQYKYYSEARRRNKLAKMKVG